MPQRDDHLAEARANRAFAEGILASGDASPTHLRWAVVLIFYSALHSVDAYLAGFGRHPRNHEDRLWHLHPASDDIWVPYRRLYDASRHARYELRGFQPKMVREVYLEQMLPAVAQLETMT